MLIPLGFNFFLCISVVNTNTIIFSYLCNDCNDTYDTVPHQKLINILAEIGVPHRLLNWIKVFLDERKQYVAVNGAASHMHDVISGVPQGSALSNLLFTIFMKNVPKLERPLTNTNFVQLGHLLYH